MNNENEPRRSGLGGIGDGLRTGFGILNAVREAIEETVEEAVNRGELSPDRARDTLREAGRRMQDELQEARERLDFVPRREFDELRAEVEELRRRLDAREPQGILTPSIDPAEIPLDLE